MDGTEEMLYGNTGNHPMNGKVALLALLLLCAMGLGSLAKAATIVKDCTCTTLASATNVASIQAYNLNNGTHTIFVSNLASGTYAWKFEVTVVVTGPGFGQKTITLNSSQAAPQTVVDGLNAMKGAGATRLEKDTTLTVTLTNNDLNGECTSATGAICANVSGLLHSLPATLQWGTGVGLIGVVWNKLAEWIVGSVGPQLRFIVIFPDGSVDVYTYQASGSGTGFVVEANASVTPSGGALAGTLQHWMRHVPSGLNGVHTVQIWGAVRANGAGGGCRVWTIQVDNALVMGVGNGGC